MVSRGYRPYSQQERKWLLVATLLMGTGGVLLLIVGAVLQERDATMFVVVGSLSLVVAVFVASVVSYRYPHGFQLPDNVDPHDTKAVLAAVRQYRHERRIQKPGS